MFMHNGIIAGFSKIRRKLLEGLSDAAYDTVQSFHSDSAVSFALFLSFLADIDTRQAPDVMLMALQKTLQFIGETQAAAGLDDSSENTSLLNFVVTDGETLIATCCVSPTDEKPASLYYAEGTTFRCDSAFIWSQKLPSLQLCDMRLAPLPVHGWCEHFHRSSQCGPCYMPHVKPSHDSARQHGFDASHTNTAIP